MPYCKNCGKKLDEKDTYCSKCGANIGETVVQQSAEAVSRGILKAIGELLWLIIIYPLLVFIVYLALPKESLVADLWLGLTALGWIFQFFDLLSGKKLSDALKKNISYAFQKQK